MISRGLRGPQHLPNILHQVQTRSIHRVRCWMPNRNTKEFYKEGTVHRSEVPGLENYSHLPVPRSTRPQNDIQSVGVQLGLDPPLEARSSFQPSTWSKFVDVLIDKLKVSDSILVSGERCLEDIREAFPEPKLVRLFFHLSDPSPKPEGFKSRTLAIAKSWSRDQQSKSLTPNPERAPLDAKYQTAWTKSIPIHGAGHTVQIIVNTSHEYLSLAPGQLRTTTNPPNVSSNQKVEQSDDFEHSFLFSLHQDVLQSALSGKHGNILDLAHRIASIVFLMHDTRYDSASLGFVNVNMQTVRQGPSPDGVELLKHCIKTGRQPMSAAVRMTRESYENTKCYAFKKSPTSAVAHTAFVALGSNVGDRLAMIELACRSMDARSIKVIRTSGLYETAPMYLEHQSPFVNGVCQVETSHSPSALLTELKAIEKDLGREKTVENGPRTIDLDILLYDDEKVDLKNLTIPHPRISEREFVLRPLCDLVPGARPPSARLLPTFRDCLEALPPAEPPLSPLTPLSQTVHPIRSEAPDRQSQLMAILNLTPDSFSDGGMHPIDVSSLDPFLESISSIGITMLDIGGQSSRPHAPDISSEEEIARVLPTIKYIRSQPAFNKLVISIDTYRAAVAAAAIEAGANIVNDVSAGTLDPDMLPLVAKLGCTIVLMHMRGTPATMNGLTSYSNGVIDGVGEELLARVAAAEAAGIRRWRMILDPGIGFAKNQIQNLELLRRFAELRAYEGLNGIPWVVGASRKGFIGNITGVSDPSERVMGTTTTVCAAIQGGTDIVRVHDLKEMAQVTKMANAIWRV